MADPIFQVLIGTIIFCSSILVSPIEKKQEVSEVFHCRILQENCDFLKIEMNGHYFIVIYSGHAEDCPCGKGAFY